MGGSGEDGGEIGTAVTCKLDRPDWFHGLLKPFLRFIPEQLRLPLLLSS